MRKNFLFCALLLFAIAASPPLHSLAYAGCVDKIAAVMLADADFLNELKQNTENLPLVGLFTLERSKDSLLAESRLRALQNVPPQFRDPDAIGCAQHELNATELALRTWIAARNALIYECYGDEAWSHESPTGIPGHLQRLAEAQTPSECMLWPALCECGIKDGGPMAPTTIIDPIDLIPIFAGAKVVKSLAQLNLLRFFQRVAPGRVASILINYSKGIGFLTHEKLRDFLKLQAFAEFSWVRWEMHHFVEQRSRKLPAQLAMMIHNTDNVIMLPQPIHNLISRIYSSSYEFSGYRIVREWTKTMSYQEQKQFGMDLLIDGLGMEIRLIESRRVPGLTMHVVMNTDEVMRNLPVLLRKYGFDR